MRPGKPSAKFRAFCREPLVKFPADFRGIRVKMAKRKKTRKKPTNALDMYLEKRGPGRPPKVRASEVSGRADNYRLMLKEDWSKLSKPLLVAQTAEAVVQALADNTAYERELASLAHLILQVLREPDFPKRNGEAQANFLADSLAARGEVNPRTSRDICARERAKQRAKSRYKILRHEYYIECECGYKGPARDNACRKCGSEIPLSLDNFGLA